MTTNTYTFALKNSDLGTPTLTSRGILTPIVSETIRREFLHEYREKILNAWIKACNGSTDDDTETTFYLFPRKSDGKLIFDIYIVISTANGQADTTISGIDFSDDEIIRVLDYIGTSNVMTNKTAQKWYRQYLRESKTTA